MQKGQQTKAAIVEAALGLATHIGLEGLSIGALADITGMSKSGVFAHFGSREELQISVIREYHTRFEQEVFYPAMSSPRGIARLSAMFDNWMKRTSIEIDSGCIYISGAVEYDDRPGAIRDHLVAMVQAWRDALERCIKQAMEAGHLRTDIEVSQMVYEMYGLILALHHDARFLHIPGSVERAEASFRRLIDSYRPQGSDSASTSTSAPKNSKSAARKAA